MELRAPLVIGDRRNLMQFPDFPSMESFALANGLRAIGSTDTGPEGIRWRHLSISLQGTDPSWDELKRVRYQFFGDDVEVFQFFPPKAEWTNLHQHCFHLWSRCDRVRMMPSR